VSHHPASSKGIQGHMRLVCAPDSRGQSSLQQQSFRAPIHLSKPHWDEDTLVLNVVNPTAGLLEDDRILQEATVHAGARLLLTMPGASRAHRVRQGWAAMEQRFIVESGAFLEVLPEVFIPQKGACYKQTTRLEVADDGELLFFESLAPGRTASGEVFQYRWLDWRTDLFIGGQHAAKERLWLEPGTATMRALSAHFAAAYYGSVLAVSKNFAIQSQHLNLLNELQSRDVWIGQSRLAHASGWSLRILSQNAPSLRYAMEKIRAALYASMCRNPPGLRRIAGR
jgi:urease accessory protein